MQQSILLFNHIRHLFSAEPDVGVGARVLRSRLLAAITVVLVVGSSVVRAQSAPEGNAHPVTRAVNESSGVNPFGEPAPPPPAMSMAEKKAFADAVDVSPLRDLAVFHNGRVKILGTLAAESLKTVAGRKDYFDLLPIEGAKPKAKKLKHDSVFTLLDLAIDPAYYTDKPLIHVAFLPLREALIEAAVQGGIEGFTDPAQREWWKKQGRLPPGVIAPLLGSVARQEMSTEYQRGIDAVHQAMQVYEHSAANFDMVAPKTAEGTWSHLSALGEQTGAGKAVRELGAAWRAGDAARVNSVITTLAVELPSINSALYPTSARSLERWYNNTRPFEWGYWAYFLALLLLLLSFGTGRKGMLVAGLALLVLGLGLHTSGFVARCVIAERFAIQNQFESMTGISLFAVIVSSVVMFATRRWIFGAAGAAVGFLFLIWATQAAIPGQQIEREAAILNTSVLLKYHVTTVLVSYGLISLGFITSLFYLGTYYAAKFKARTAGAAAGGRVDGEGMVEVSAAALGLDDSAPKGTQRVLADLDAAQMIMLQLAFWALGVGILLGAWWADHSWGRWWAFDPKEVWALVTWIVYLIVIHARFMALKNRSLVTAWLSIAGFFVMLWTYFGVNLLLPGLHAYA
ncbi:MAG: cytochrome c biogenesis protein CcsA [Phycisphaerales bacterium]|nr:cytochrome c biogenesis protein CcsA [Phycisphaerales bacterium]